MASVVVKSWYCQHVRLCRSTLTTHPIAKMSIAAVNGALRGPVSLLVLSDRVELLGEGAAEDIVVDGVVRLWSEVDDDENVPVEVKL